MGTTHEHQKISPVVTNPELIQIQIQIQIQVSQKSPNINRRNKTLF
jgi:hypothetical protein